MVRALPIVPQLWINVSPKNDPIRMQPSSKRNSPTRPEENNRRPNRDFESKNFGDFVGPYRFLVRFGYAHNQPVAT
jgi:hypothetical protein